MVPTWLLHNLPDEAKHELLKTSKKQIDELNISTGSTVNTER
jgi:hypothetical protein